MNTIYLSAALALQATEGEELPKQFKGVAYSGGRAQPYNAVIDLASLTLAETMPLLADHDHSQVIGTITGTELSHSSLTVFGTIFSDFDEAAQKIVKKAQRGAAYQMSVGIYEFSDEYIPEGQSVELNQQTFTGPLVVLRRGKVREVSVVALGADDKTNAQFFSLKNHSQNHLKEDAMTIEELQGKVAELEAALSAEKTAHAELSAKVETERKAQRTEDVKALFSAQGREYSEDKAKPYLEMSAEHFAAVAEDFKAAEQARKQNLPEHLFRAHAQQDNSEQKGVLLSVVEARTAK